MRLTRKLASIAAAVLAVAVAVVVPATSFGSLFHAAGSTARVRPHAHRASKKPHLLVIHHRRAAPRLRGSAVEGHTLKVSTGRWANRPKKYKFAWKDCNKHGARCVTIKKAVKRSYKLRKSDVGRVVRGRVTAINKAGATSAMTAPSALVRAPAAPAAPTPPPGATATVPPTGSGGAVPPGGGGGSGGSVQSTAFPLRLSSNGRYLVQANGAPFLMVGDSPQSVIGNLSEANANAYFDDRAAHGFNAVWINLLCDSYTQCNSDGTTFDGIRPFSSGSGPASYSFGSGLCGGCNAAFFSRAHDMIAHAEADGIEVLLDPIETGNCQSDGWFQMLSNGGDGTVSTTDADYRYGEYLGNEFKDLSNIIWFSGNDFSCWATASAFHNMQTVVNGIHATDPAALQTDELDGKTNSDNDTTRLGGLLGLDGVYVYGATYEAVQAAYNAVSGFATKIPVFMEEASYEGQLVNGDGCGPGPAGDPTVRNCRLQEWWTMTSGATGQLYGGNYNCSCSSVADDGSYGIENGFTDANIDTTGATELGYETKLLTSINWPSLVPDQSHAVVTSGEGACSGNEFSDISGDNCVTTASDYAGTAGSASLAVSYLPDPSSFSSITVNMADFSGPVIARWYDPTNGSFTSINGGAAIANSGSHSFQPTANNSVGDKDWVLLLQKQ